MASEPTGVVVNAVFQRGVNTLGLTGNWAGFVSGDATLNATNIIDTIQLGPETGGSYPRLRDGANAGFYNYINNNLSDSSVYLIHSDSSIEVTIENGENQFGSQIVWTTAITVPSWWTNNEMFSIVIADGGQIEQTRLFALDLPDNVSNTGVTLAPGNGRVTINWADAVDATGYQIERSTDGVNWGNRITSVNSNVTVTGLTNNTLYYFRFRATNANGESDWSNGTHSATPEAPNPGTPDAPSLAEGIQRLIGEVVDPTDTGGSPINERQYRVKKQSDTAWSNGIGIPDTSSPYNFTVPNLDDGDLYEVQVRVRNSGGHYSEWSDSTFETPTSPEPTTGLIFSDSLPDSSNEDARMLIEVELGGSVFFWRRNYIGQENLGKITTDDSRLPPEIDRIRWITGSQRLLFNRTGDDTNFADYPNDDTHSIYIAYEDAGGNIALMSRPWSERESVGGGFVRWRFNDASYSDFVDVLDNISNGDRLLIVFAETGTITLSAPPGAPSLSLTSGNMGITGTVTDPTDTGSAEIDRREYSYKETSEPDSAYSEPTEITGTMFSIGSLTNGTSYDVRVRVRNAHNEYSDWVTETSTPVQPDSTPSLFAVADQSAAEGTAFSLVLTAAMDGDPPLTYSVTGLPDWLSFNPATRLLAGTPDAGGMHTLTYRVEDTDGDIDSVSFMLNVDAIPEAPSVNNYTATQDVLFEQILPEGIGGDPPLSYAVSNRPTWMSFNPTTRLLSGTPTSEGTHELTYTVTDDDGDTDSTAFTVTVAGNEVTGQLVDMTAVIDQTPDHRDTLFEIVEGIGSVSGDNIITELVKITGMYWSEDGDEDRRKPLITDYENYGLGDYLPNLSGKSLYIWDGDVIIELRFSDARASADAEISWNPDENTDGMHRINIGGDDNPLEILNSMNRVYIETD